MAGQLVFGLVKLMAQTHGLPWLAMGFGPASFSSTILIFIDKQSCMIAFSQRGALYFNLRYFRQVTVMQRHLLAGLLHP